MPRTLVAAKIVVLGCLLSPAWIHAAIPQQERDALIALYNSTNGANWKTKTGWMGSPGTECQWYGVTCNSNLTNLTALSLYDNQLSGSIPPELGNLTNLTGLSLYGNQLSGSIPPELGNLTNLTGLYLYGNQLSGSIPPELGNLTNLAWLILHGNQLSGSIPPELGSLTNLTGLYLSSNQLSGSIPPELGNLTKLLGLYLSSNQLSGSIPRELGNLTNLTWLYLNINQLSGSIPPELGNLTNLTALYLYNNQLSGSIPPELGNLTNLTELYLNINQLSGSIPPELGNLTELMALDLSYNQLNGSIPPELGNLTKLVVLNLFPNYAGQPPVHSSINTGGSVTVSTAGSDPRTQRVGYAAITVNSGSAPYGTAVFVYNINGITVSETGVPSTPPTTHARIFIDYRFDVRAVPARPDSGTVDVNTGIALVNCGSANAEITYTLLNTDGLPIAVGHGNLAAGYHISKFINQLSDVASDFVLPAGFQFASLDIVSSQPVSVLALRMTTNQRKEDVFTSTPVADMNQPLVSTPVYFPQLSDGGGMTTSLILLNTSGTTENGTLQIFDNDGLPVVVQQTGGPASSSFRYSIPSDGIFHFQTDGSPVAQRVGWVRVTPDSMNSTPVGSGVFDYNPVDTLVTESGIPSVFATTHARIYVDLSDNHNTGLAIANPMDTDTAITILAFQTDGITPAGDIPVPIPLPALGHAAKFADEFFSGLPVDFTGVLDISSPRPFAALTLRSLNNERGDFLMSTFPVADVNRPAPSPVVFPHIADGFGLVTQFILLSPGAASSVTLTLYGEDGKPFGAFH